MKARDSSHHFNWPLGGIVRCALKLSTGRLHEDVSIASLDKRWPPIAIIRRKARINSNAGYLLAALEASESGTLLVNTKDWRWPPDNNINVAWTDRAI